MRKDGSGVPPIAAPVIAAAEGWKDGHVRVAGVPARRGFAIVTASSLVLRIERYPVLGVDTGLTDGRSPETIDLVGGDCYARLQGNTERLQVPTVYPTTHFFWASKLALPTTASLASPKLQMVLDPSQPFSLPSTANAQSPQEPAAQYDGITLVSSGAVKETRPSSISNPRS
ncbi:hypothetical protein EI94DRAFT_1701018 [Lactarius quietus]|nr:hypothetical protein EI94DRAFT_1701018 [Lactarius quietus]